MAIIICEHCEREFDSQKKYRIHVNQHEKPFKCKDCPEAFAANSNLKRHRETRHSSINSKFRCQIQGCRFCSSRSDNLRRHMRKQHPKESLEHHRMDDSDEDKSQKTAFQQSVELQIEQRKDINWMSVFETGNITVAQMFLRAGHSVHESTEDGKTAMHLAASKGLTEMASLLLEHGADMSARDHLGNSPLHLASLFNQLDFVKSLIDQEVDINSVNGKNDTAFSIAAENGHSEILRFLLSKPHIATSIRDSFSQLPIHKTAAQGHLILFQTLLELDIDHCETDRDFLSLWDIITNQPQQERMLRGFILKRGSHFSSTLLNTLLSQEISRGDDLLLMKLVELGANIQGGIGVDGKQTYPLHLACRHGREKLLIASLHQGQDLSSRDSKGSTPFQNACNGDHAGIVRILQSHGLDLWETHSGFAIETGATTVIQLMLNEDRSLLPPHDLSTSVSRFLRKVQKGRWARTPSVPGDMLNILYSIYNSREAGHDYQTKKIWGGLLRFAVVINCQDVIDALLSRKLPGALSGSSLCFSTASSKNNSKVISQLLWILSRQSNSKRPLRIAFSTILKGIKELHRWVWPLFKDYGFDLMTFTDHIEKPSLHIIASGPDSGLAVGMFVDQGGDVNARNQYGQSALHVAVMIYNFSALQALVSRGANSDARDNRGKTALHSLSEADFKWNESLVEKIAELLLGSGIDLNAKDLNGQTALHCAAEKGWWWSSDKCGQLLLVLLKIGCNPNIRDDDGNTALYYAAKRDVSGPVLQALSNAMLDPSIPNNIGETALHAAIKDEWLWRGPGLRKRVSKLLEAGVKDTANIRGETAVSIAERRLSECSSAGDSGVWTNIIQLLDKYHKMEEKMVI